MPSVTEKARSVHTIDGGIVLDIKNGRMFSLNCSGSAIFQLLKQGLPEERIAEELVNRYGITREVAKRDVSDFCSSLRNHDLLATRPDRGSE
jgi:Coenzyme PQQ synthesis protein D (PqqD)